MGLTELIRFGEQFDPQKVPALEDVAYFVHPGSGYDGQFHAQMALHPLLQDPAVAPAVDNPGYRFRRILPSWMAFVLGGGQPWWILQAFALLNVFAWLLLAWLLTRWVRPTEAEGLVRWLGCLLGVGAIASVTHATADLLGCVVVLWAVARVEQGRNLSAAGGLAAAILCKESFAIAGLMRLDGFWGGVSAWRGRIGFGLLAVAPLVTWLGYLTYLGYPPSGGSSGNFTAPGAGFVFEFGEALALLSEGRLHNALAVVALTVQIASLLWFRRPEQPLWRVGIAFILLATVLGPAVWEADPGAAYRVLIPLTVAFNLCLPSGHRATWPLLLLGNSSALIGLRYLLRFWW